MGNSLRRQPQGAIYEELKTPVTEDVLQVGLLFAFGIIAFSFIVIIPGIRGLEVRFENLLYNTGIILFFLAESLGNTSCIHSSLDRYSTTSLQF